MSSQAASVINYINKGAANRAASGATVKTWPGSDNISYGDALKMIDIYHDLVANKKFSLPNSTENIRKLTDKMREILGIQKNTPGWLNPTLVIKTLIDNIDTGIGADLYQWVYPDQITYVPEKSILDRVFDNSQPGFFKTASDITKNLKWVAVAGLTIYIASETGILKRFRNV